MTGETAYIGPAGRRRLALRLYWWSFVTVVAMMTAMGLIGRTLAYLNSLGEVERNIAAGLIVAAIGTVGGLLAWLGSIALARLRPQAVSADAAKEWGKLEKRFAQLEADAIAASHRRHDAATIVSATKFDDDHNPKRVWEINSHDPDCRRDAESLCKLAGSLLLRSRTGRTLSKTLRKTKDDKDRWLSFLMERGESRVPEMRMQLSNVSKDGKEDTMYLDEIENIAPASVRACIECKAQEFKE